MFRQTKKAVLLTAALGALFFQACKKDNAPATPPAEQASHPWIIYTGGTVGNWGGYIYALKDMPSGTVDLSTLSGHQIKNSFGGNTFGTAIFKLNNDAAESGISRLVTDKDGNVTTAGFIATPNTPEGNYLVVSASQGYYWDLGAGGMKLQTFDPTGMQRTGEIDFSSLTRGSSYESAGQYMIAVRDNKLFVDIQYGVKTSTDWQVKPDFDSVFVAVYDLITKQIEGVTSYPKAANIGLFSSHPLWSIDAVTGDLYIAAVSNFKTQDPPAKILRIKKGMTKFDAGYEISVNAFRPKSDYNQLFAYNGKLYTKICRVAMSYYDGGEHGEKYRDDIWDWTEIDANSKTAKKLDIPVDNFYAYQNAFYAKGKIYFISNNKAQGFSGVYELDPVSGATKETFHLSNSGRIMGFNKLD